MIEFKQGDRVEFNQGQGKLQGVVVEIRTNGVARQAVIRVTDGTGVSEIEATGREYVRNVHFLRLVAS